MSRPTWDEYFQGIAEAVSVRGDCTRRKVGAVIAHPTLHTNLGQGYNGAPRGEPGCLEGACPRATSDVPPLSSYSNCISIHAEVNAILTAVADIRGGILYCTYPPCGDCAKLIRQAGISRAVWPGGEWVQGSVWPDLSRTIPPPEDDRGECGKDHLPNPVNKFSGDVICSDCGMGLGKWR